GLPDAKREWSLEGIKSSSDNGISIKIRQCENCFAVYPPKEKACPMCGYVPEVKEQKEYKVDESVELKEISEEDKDTIVLDFRRPEDCKNIKELAELAKNRGYKSGWIYYQAKSRGWL